MARTTIFLVESALSLYTPSQMARIMQSAKQDTPTPSTWKLWTVAPVMRIPNGVVCSNIFARKITQAQSDNFYRQAVPALITAVKSTSNTDVPYPKTAITWIYPTSPWADSKATEASQTA